MNKNLFEPLDDELSKVKSSFKNINNEFNELVDADYIEKINDDDDDDDENKTDDDGSPNYRDKYKELKEAIKEQLSADTQNAIDLDEEKMEEIIEQFKKRGIGKQNSVELQKIKTQNIGSRTLSK